MVELFNIDATTKLHRLMRHVFNHIVAFGCVRRGSSEENEQLHKQYKQLYYTTNKHTETLAPQLLRPHMHSIDPPDLQSDQTSNQLSEADSALLSEMSAADSNLWTTLKIPAITTVINDFHWAHEAGARHITSRMSVNKFDCVWLSLELIINLRNYNKLSAKYWLNELDHSSNWCPAWKTYVALAFQHIWIWIKLIIGISHCHTCFIK